MPTSEGWPTEAEIIERYKIVSSDPLGADILGQVNFILQGVILDFQSPQDPHGGGGTGRTFTPITETRIYDGTGLPKLFLGDDIVPGTSPTVILYNSDSPLANVVVQEYKRGLGFNVLVIQNYGSSYPGLWEIGFPTGLQNVYVTATWGYAAQVPNNIYQAVMGETIYRLATSFQVEYSGVGVEIQVGNNKINTAAGVSVWKESSPLGVMHGIYESTVKRYRTSSAWKVKSLIPRMS